MLGVAFLAGLICFFLGYGALILNVQGAVVFKWETTVIIMCMHMQTVAIISSLRLAWPPSVEETASFISLGALQLEAMKPECLVDSAEGEPAC